MRQSTTHPEQEQISRTATEGRRFGAWLGLINHGADETDGRQSGRAQRH